MAAEHNYHVIDPDYNIIRQPDRDAAIKYTQDNKSYEMLVDGKDYNGEYYGKWKAEARSRSTTINIAASVYMAGAFGDPAQRNIDPMIKEASSKHRVWPMSSEKRAELAELLNRTRLRHTRPHNDEKDATQHGKWRIDQVVYNLNLSVVLAPPVTVLIWDVKENVFTYQFIWEFLSVRELRAQWFAGWSVICAVKGGTMGNGSDLSSITKFGTEEINIPWTFEQFQVEYYSDTFDDKLSKSDLGPIRLIIDPIGSRELLRDRENDYYAALKKADDDIKASTAFAMSHASRSDVDDDDDDDDEDTRAYAYVPRERKQIPSGGSDSVDTSEDVDLSDPTIPWPQVDEAEPLPRPIRRPERRLPLSRQPRIVSHSSRGRGIGRGSSLYGRPHMR
jgi:hypothetical protein